MIEIKRMRWDMLTREAYLEHYCEHEKCEHSITINSDKMLIFDIFISKQVTFKIIYICFSVTSWRTFCYSVQNITLKRYNLYEEIHICDLFSFLTFEPFSIRLTHTSIYSLSGQASYDAVVRILLITKKPYSIQNRFWHENVEKSSLYHISTI